MVWIVQGLFIVQALQSTPDDRISPKQQGYWLWISELNVLCISRDYRVYRVVQNKRNTFSNRYRGVCDFPSRLKFGIFIEMTSPVIMVNFQTDSPTLTARAFVQVQPVSFSLPFVIFFGFQQFTYFTGAQRDRGGAPKFPPNRCHQRERRPLPKLPI